MGYKLITQTVLLITSFVIVFTFVMPKVEKISEKQDKILEFDSTLNKTTELNNKLRELVATKQSISPNEIRALNKYMPPTINHIEVMRDIQNIFDNIGMPMISMSASEESSVGNEAVVEGAQQSVSGPNEANIQNLVYRDFTVEFVAEYDIFKQILASIESNAYPLEVISLSFDAQDDINPELGNQAQMRYSLLLRAFALTSTQ